MSRTLDVRCVLECLVQKLNSYELNSGCIPRYQKLMQPWKQVGKAFSIKALKEMQLSQRELDSWSRHRS